MKDVMTFNLVKGLVVNHISPKKFVYFLEQLPEIKNYYRNNTQLSHTNWLFYILDNIKNVKKWQKELIPIFNLNDWDKTNNSGNNVFLESVKLGHLKTAKNIALLGVNINQINNDNKNFADLILDKINTQELIKKKYWSYLLFINTFLENEYPISVNNNIFDSIKKIVILSDEIFLNFKKKSIYGYEDYWNDIILFNNELLSKLDLARSAINKRQLDDKLRINTKKPNLIKI